jgi:hypothetical protein
MGLLNLLSVVLGQSFTKSLMVSVVGAKVESGLELVLLAVGMSPLLLLGASGFSSDSGDLSQSCLNSLWIWNLL